LSELEDAPKRLAGLKGESFPWPAKNPLRHSGRAEISLALLSENKTGLQKLTSQLARQIRLMSMVP
jgi:hypothetical protein